MKTKLLILIVLCSCATARAQVYTMNWASAFGATPWADGNTTKTATNIDGSEVNCTVTVTKTGGVFSKPYGASYAGPMTPTVNSTITVGSSTANLQVAVDFSSSNQRAEITLTFSQPVWNLRFSVGDIDRLTPTSLSYLDRVTVSAQILTTTYMPTITKLDAVTDPDWLQISGNVVQINSAANTADNAASESGDARGTANYAFNGKYVTSATIRYDNDPLTQVNPGVQFIGLSNITFQKGIVLPVNLKSFDGVAQNKNANLSWEVSEESGLKEYIIERSHDGANDFRAIGSVSPKGETEATPNYNYTDYNVYLPVAYYRLKMVDVNGSIKYSRIVKLQFGASTELQAFPTSFQTGINVSLSSASATDQELVLINSLGQVVFAETRRLGKGRNSFWLALPSSLSKGDYYLRNGTSVVRLLKQ